VTARTLCAVAAALLLAPGAAAAQEHHGGPAGVETPDTISFSAFDPGLLEVVVGDSVRWTNASVRRHDVTADDGSWTSGGLEAGGSFAHRFDAPGPVAYHCSIHPFMRATIGVHRLLLAHPEAPGVPGRPFTVRGRTALAPGAPIAIEADAGGRWETVSHTAAGEDGTFAASFAPSATAQLRAVSGADMSPAVPLLVIDRRVTASARTRHGRTVVRASVLPAAPGAHVVLQLRLRERFGWWPVRHARLDAGSRVRFRLHARRSVRARVVLTLSDRATPLALSPTLRVGPPRRAAAPHPRHHRH
jgi:plastocyanin